jgi:hypothetical protein
MRQMKHGDLFLNINGEPFMIVRQDSRLTWTPLNPGSYGLTPVFGTHNYHEKQHNCTFVCNIGEKRSEIQ